MTENTTIKDSQSWDYYWLTKEKSRFSYNSIAESYRFFYNSIAKFYRRFIILPSLNRFIMNFFNEGAQVLHAGCGSGQVDAAIRGYVWIKALDISSNALKMYKKENGKNSDILQGTIFHLPLQSGTLDGIYNLGVMEHFNSNEIDAILKEFYRVLKPNGIVIVFWPPEYGLSVLFFKVLKRVLKLFTGKSYKLHPDEFCRVQSRSYADYFFVRGNFKVLSYSFGARDLFTYVTVVAQK